MGYYRGFQVQQFLNPKLVQLLSLLVQQLQIVDIFLRGPWSIAQFVPNLVNGKCTIHP